MRSTGWRWDCPESWKKKWGKMSMNCSEPRVGYCVNMAPLETADTGRLASIPELFLCILTGYIKIGGRVGNWREQPQIRGSNRLPLLRSFCYIKQTTLILQGKSSNAVIPTAYVLPSFTWEIMEGKIIHLSRKGTEVFWAQVLITMLTQDFYHCGRGRELCPMQDLPHKKNRVCHLA